MYKKYDIVFIDLNPKKWHTQSWIRPWIIIQNNLFNSKSPTLIIVPLTSTIKEIFPSEFIIKSSKENWLKNDSRFLWSQIITIDKTYIIEKIWILETKYHNLVKESLEISLDLEDNF